MIAFLGTGLLGSGFVRAFLSRGEAVHVWNRSADKARALEQYGAKAFDDPAQAVRGATRVHIALSDDAAVDDVLERAQAGIGHGVHVVDHTTTAAARTRDRAKRLDALGVQFMHAPVFMGPANALNATGVMMASGNRARFDALAPVLEQMTGKLVYVGEDPARAAGMKLLGNQFIVTLTVGLMDTLSLAEALDIPADDVAHLFEFFNPGAQVPARLKRIRDEDYDNPTWTLAMARKDVRLMMESLTEGDRGLLVLPAIARAMSALVDRGDGGKDWTIVARAP